MKNIITLRVEDDEGKVRASREFEGTSEADVLANVQWQQVFATLQQQVVYEITPNLTYEPHSDAARASTLQD